MGCITEIEIKLLLWSNRKGDKKMEVNKLQFAKM